MALPALRAQLKSLVQSMYDEGVLDREFYHLQDLQDAKDPHFVVDVITIFCEDTHRILTELTQYLDQPDVDYYKVDIYVHQLKGSSSSIGANLLKLSCIDLQQACDDNHKERCLQALIEIKHEYCHLQSKFEILVQLEKRISEYETNQHHSRAGVVLHPPPGVSRESF